MYHYTWGVIVKDKTGTEIWKFDKRFYTDAKDALLVGPIPQAQPCRPILVQTTSLPLHLSPPPSP